MDLDLFLGNKTKVDILKYLLFAEDKISARELENHLGQSFPAIKKQIDNLEKAGVVAKNKIGNRWQLVIVDRMKPFIQSIFEFSIKDFLYNLHIQNSSFLIKCVLGDFFNKNDSIQNVGVDLVFVHKKLDNVFLDDIKKQIVEFLDSYFLDLKVSFMDIDNYNKRLKFADKFVIKLNKFEKYEFDDMD